MRSIRLAALAGLAAIALSAPFAAAQTPARFPAIPAEQVESMVARARCGDTVTAVARTAGRAEGWQGFAVRICSPENQPAGSAVAWMRQSGRRDFVLAAADGTPLYMPEGASEVMGDQQAQRTIFVTQIDRQNVVCWIGRSNYRHEPFAASFCYHLDAQGRAIPRR